jgi:hypothetical protein
MAREHEDEFVLIKGNEIVGVFPDDSSAIREGYRRFGRDPFLVKEVTDVLLIARELSAGLRTTRS